MRVCPAECLADYLGVATEREGAKGVVEARGGALKTELQTE